MTDSPWIMSEGGPLLCVEKVLKADWLGIDGSCLSNDDIATDYDRICRLQSFAHSIAVNQGQGLALQGSFDSRFWLSAAGGFHIVRIECCEPDFDEDDYMASFCAEMASLSAVEEVFLSFKTSSLVMFDSAASGSDLSERSVSADITPGAYSIKTFQYDRDPSASLVIHRFDRLGDP